MTIRINRAGPRLTLKEQIDRKPENRERMLAVEFYAHYSELKFRSKVRKT